MLIDLLPSHHIWNVCLGVPSSSLYTKTPQSYKTIRTFYANLRKNLQVLTVRDTKGSGTSVSKGRKGAMLTKCLCSKRYL